METVGYAALQIIPSARGFTSSLGSQINPGVQSVGTSAGGRFRTGFLGSIKGIAGPLLATMGIAAVGSFVKSAVSEASDLNESLNAVNVTFGKNAAGISALGEESARALGLSQTEFNGLAVRFSSFAGTIAGKGGDVVGTMDDITTRASDFASVMNLDVAEAAALFQSGLAGETEPLRRYGLDLSAAAVENYALSKGIATSAESMTEAQKVQARYELLMKGTNKTAGDFANTSGGLANSQRILSAEWSNMKASIGSALLPVLASLATFVGQKIIPGLTALYDLVVKGDFTGAFADAFGIAEDSPIIGTILRIRELVGGFIGDLQSGGIAKALGGLFGGGGAVGTDLPIMKTINQTKETITSLVAGAKRLFEDIKPSIIAVGQTITQDVIPALVNFWNAIQPIVRVFIEQLIPILGNYFKAVYSVVQGVLKIFSGILTFLSGVFTGNWGKAWDGIKQIFSGVWQAIKGILSAALGTIWNGIKKAFGLIGTVVSAGWNKVKQWTAAAWNWVWGKIGDLLGRVVGFIRGRIALAANIVRGGWQIVRNVTSTVWGWITGFVGGIVGRVVGFIRNAWNTAQALTSAAWQAVQSAVSNGVSHAIDVVSRLPGRILGFFTGLATDMKEAAWNMIAGFVQGIWDRAQDIMDAIKSAITDRLPGWIKGPLGIESPSKLTFGYGQMIAAGLALGIYEGSNKVEQATKDMAERALAAARSVLDRRKELAREVIGFAREIAGAIASFGSVTAYEATENAMGISRTGAGAVIGDMQQRLRVARQFSQNLLRLKRLGLNNASLQEIISAGPEAGSQIAAALVQGGQRAIRETNQLERAFSRTSRRIGDIGARSQFGTSTAEARAVAGATLNLHKGSVTINFDGDPGQSGKRIKRAVEEAFEDILDRLEAKGGRR